MLTACSRMLLDAEPPRSFLLISHNVCGQYMPYGIFISRRIWCSLRWCLYTATHVYTFIISHIHISHIC